MKILLINPNTSAPMTQGIALEAGNHLPPGATLVPVTAEFGTEVIASRASFAIAAHAALDAYARHGAQADAVVLACFGDPGLAALREMACVPVVGLLEASIAEASRGGRSFAIATPGTIWMEMLDELVRISPHAAAFHGVFALSATGLQVSQDPESFVEPLRELIAQAAAAGAQSVILGGSVLAGFGPRLAGGIPLVNPLAAAMECLQHLPSPSPRVLAPSLGSLGLSTELGRLLASPAPR